MPVLAKAKWEIFAQELANGTNPVKAYEKAGYRPNRGNACTLKQTKAVQDRVNELLAERGSAITTKYAAEVEYTRERLLSMLQRAYDEAIDSERGQSAAVAAVVAMARITGQIIDRREVGQAGAFDGMTDEELVAEATRRARELGIAGPRLVEDDNKRSP
jgi:predicted house-cleaning noncanonical NTP pyrophosphatase (MazG superfamily)